VHTGFWPEALREGDHLEDPGVDGRIILKRIYKKNEMGGACSTYGRQGSAYRILVGRPEGWRPLGRPRRRWEDTIKVYLKEIDLEGMDGLIWLRTGTGGGLL
jgi:hypothetical protein